jgi:hypothetical protein
MINSKKPSINTTIEKRINELNKHKKEEEEEDILSEDSEYIYTWKMVVIGAMGATFERVKVKKSEFVAN